MGGDDETIKKGEKRKRGKKDQELGK